MLPNRRHRHRRKPSSLHPDRTTSGLAANGRGMAAGSGWPGTGVIRPIPAPFGFAVTGIGGRMVGAGQRDTGADPRATKLHFFFESPVSVPPFEWRMNYPGILFCKCGLDPVVGIEPAEITTGFGQWPTHYGSP